MKNAQKPEKIALGSLLRQLKEGRFVIPDFQREFEWKPWDIRDLLKSVFQDYYIGTLLLWKGKTSNFDSLECENIYGHDGEEKREYIVLDGQQRLTALYYALHAPNINFPKRKSPVLYYLCMDHYFNGNSDESIEYIFTSKKWTKLTQDQNELFFRHYFPLSLLGQGTRSIIKWMDDYSTFWQSLSEYPTDNESYDKYFTRYIDNAADAIKAAELENQHKYFKEQCLSSLDYKKRFDGDLEELETDYHISYIELDKEIPIDKVCDIFTQINSKGVRLDIFDLMNALLKPKGVQLKKLWREAQDKLEFLETGKMNIYILQVMSILLQNYCSAKYLYFLLPEEKKLIRNSDGSFSKITLIENAQDFEDKWHDAVNALELAIQTLSNQRDYGAIKSDYVPYPSIVAAFSAIRRFARNSGIFDRHDVGEKIRRWYWASIFSNRYSSSVETSTAKDFADMKKWFGDDELVPQAISDYKERFSNPNLKSETKKGTAIYTSILNLLIISGAKDFANGQYPEYDDLDDHHIVPHSWGKEHVGTDINSLCNRTLISSNTNRKILSDKMPSIYISDLIEKYGHEDVRAILDSHFISLKAQEILLREPFTKEDYFEFIEEREKSFIKGIDTYLFQYDIPRDIQLTALDQQLESIELQLRAIINTELGGNVELLPQHLVINAQKRIDGLLRKDINKSKKDFASLIKILAFFDLRDLEQTILSKSLYDRFRDIIGAKEIFRQRFSQLAELRNPIRHSRDIDNVIKKEGEAAIEWFNQLLRK